MLKHIMKNLILPLGLAALTALLPVVSLAAQGPEDGAVSAAENLADPGEQEETEPQEPEGSEEAELPETSEPGGILDSEDVLDPERGEEPVPSPQPGEDLEPDENGFLETEAEVDDSQPMTYAQAVGALKTGTHDTYMSGYSGKLFKPENFITRAEVCQMLYNLLKELPEGGTSSFSDVRKGTDWFEPAVTALCGLGVISGYSDGTFRPNRYITRAEFVKILGRCFPAGEGDVAFSDVPEDHFAYQDIASALAKGWLSGYADGTFKPDNNIKRCEAAKVMNIALERKGDGYAADRDTQEFRDVPKTHWAFLDIAEAADPLNEPDPPPDELPNGIRVGSTVRVNAETGLNIRKAPVDGAVITAVVNGTLLTVTDISQNPWLGVRTASGITGYSHADYLVKYTGGGNTSQTGTLSHSTLSLRQYASALLDVKVDNGVSSMKWVSSNEAVAKVGYAINYNSKEQSAVVYAGGQGTAVLSLRNSSGKELASCTVTVTGPQAVRSAYGEGNIVPLNQEFDLVAVTDTSRDEVRFDITGGPASGSYTSSAYTEESAVSKHGLPTNTVRVFRRTVKFSMAGVYTLRVYSARNGAYDSESCQFTVQVTQAASVTATSNDSRRVSGRMIYQLKDFEGYVAEIEDDNVTSGNPTVGYGKVMHAGEMFYNNMTRTEAFAKLTETVNDDIYAAAAENFRKEYGIRMSQAQFDALVSLAYNCGTGVFSTSRYETPNIILNMVTPPTDCSANKPYSGTLNVTKAKLYAQPDYNSTLLVEVPKGTAVSVTEIKVNRSATKQEVWYKLSYGGKTGWMASGYVKLNGNFTRDLAYADTTSLANEFLQWHRPGGSCTPGLLYRRLAECKIFFFGNYDEGKVDGVETPNYRKNTYKFRYPPCCAHLGK